MEFIASIAFLFFAIFSMFAPMLYFVLKEDEIKSKEHPKLIIVKR